MTTLIFSKKRILQLVGWAIITLVSIGFMYVLVYMFAFAKQDAVFGIVLFSMQLILVVVPLLVVAISLLLIARYGPESSEIKLASRPTTAVQKLSASVIAVLAVVFIAVPFETFMPFTQWRYLLIFLMLAYNLLFAIRRDKRDLGMLIIGTYWERHYSLRQYFVFTVLYTLSFCSLLFWIVFPGDILLVNLILIQLPCIYLTKTTLHGWLSGDMRTVALA